MNPSMKSLEKPSMYLLELSPTTSICRRCYKIKGKHPLVSLGVRGKQSGDKGRGRTASVAMWHLNPLSSRHCFSHTWQYHLSRPSPLALAALAMAFLQERRGPSRRAGLRRWRRSKVSRDSSYDHSTQMGKVKAARGRRRTGFQRWLWASWASFFKRGVVGRRRRSSRRSCTLDLEGDWLT